MVDVGSDELVLCAPTGMPLGAGPLDLATLASARWLLDGSREVFDAYLLGFGNGLSGSPDPRLNGVVPWPGSRPVRALPLNRATVSARLAGSMVHR